jgi:ATP-dependent Zn protease
MMNYLLYIDPGSGSYLVQVIIAAALGVAFFFKNLKMYILRGWQYVKSLFFRTPKQNKN